MRVALGGGDRRHRGIIGNHRRAGGVKCTMRRRLASVKHEKGVFGSIELYARPAEAGAKACAFLRPTELGAFNLIVQEAKK